MRSRRTEKTKTIKRPFVTLPDYRDTGRGNHWLTLMIEASEGKRTFDEVVDEMQTPLFKREREPGEEG